MFQPNHRGIYEYLWSEHKYLAISVSIKAFQGTAGKLGKIPQCTTLLRRIAMHGKAEKPELLNALLSAYMHLKPLVKRQQRELVVKKLLADLKKGSQMIFDLACQLNETSLWGCRLFYPFGKAVYKFWDVQELPGLWLCFGPFQLHISPENVAKRICKRCDFSPQELKKFFKDLKNGVNNDEYKDWPAKLRQEIENINLAATPGLKTSLHPRFEADNIPENISTNDPVDLKHFTAMVLEETWDKINPESIGILPDPDKFEKGYKNVTALVSQKSAYSSEECYEWLTEVFSEQKQIESGRKPA